MCDSAVADLDRVRAETSRTSLDVGLQAATSFLMLLERRRTQALLAEQLTSEYRVKTEGRGRTVDEWRLRVASSDNHWLDGLVGCAVAASMEGVELPGLEIQRPKRRRVPLAELMGRR